jgi:predicted DNA-binding transcriptional regulator AlpA
MIQTNGKPRRPFGAEARPPNRQAADPQPEIFSFACGWNLPAVSLPSATGQPMLLSAGQAAELCGVSEPTWWRRNSAKEVPAPAKFGGRTCWHRLELERWLAAGLPARETWEAMNARGLSDG